MISLVFRQIADTRLSGFLLIIALLGLWEWTTALSADLSFYLPRFSQVVAATWAHTRDGSLPLHLLSTVQRTGLGFAIGALVALPLGLVIGFFRPLFHVAEPTLELLRPAPAIAMLPLAVLFLGLGLQMQVFLIAWGVFWPVLSSTMDGVRGVDPVLVQTAETYRYKSSGILRRIVFPAALPFTMAGLRLGLTIALILAVFVEMFTADNGMGALIVQSRETLRLPDVYSAILVVAILGYGLNALFLKFEGAVIGWHLSRQRGV